MTVPHVAVFHNCTSRPHNPRFQLELDDLNASVMKSIEAMGWTAELIPTSERLLTKVLKTAADADLVVIMGGEDVHPSLYAGEPEYRDQGHHELISDKAQILIIKQAAATGKPLVGICRGHQLINVAFGGTLIQHIDSSAFHRGEDGRMGPFVRHPARLTERGLSVYQGTETVLDGEVVHSTHHQAIGELGDGLVVTALAPDGVIEAVAHESLPIHGVQWHPEHPDAPGLPIARLLSGALALAEGTEARDAGVRDAGAREESDVTILSPL